MSKTHALPEFSLANKVVLVSGAARGLGLTQAEALLAAGATGTIAIGAFDQRESSLANILRSICSR